MDGAMLQENVRRQLEYEPHIDSGRIGVSADESGIVTLTGSVPTYLDKSEAEEAAKRVYGVRGVANRIEVEPAGAGRRSDRDIAEAALASLKWRAAIPDERIQVTVEDGWVTLDGDVENHFQRQETERVVRQLLGVVGVTNRIRVAPRVTPEPDAVRKDIEQALVRSARLDARGIRVRTEDSRVVLEGSVRSWAELEEAAGAAWAAPGVAEVDNRISVIP